jgi:hypothetical protein
LLLQVLLCRPDVLCNTLKDLFGEPLWSHTPMSSHFMSSFIFILVLSIKNVTLCAMLIGVETQRISLSCSLSKMWTKLSPLYACFFQENTGVRASSW